MTHLVLSASSITGDSVRNPDGDDIGRIEDLMIDTADGKIEYAVLSFGGFLGIMGMGDKYFAIPFERFTVDRENQCMVLNVDKERLKAAPGFDKDHWPNFADAAFRTSIRTHYGQHAAVI